MLRLSPGSHVHNLLQVLSVCGEYPARSLDILRSEQVIKRTVLKFESAQDICALIVFIVTSILYL